MIFWRVGVLSLLTSAALDGYAETYMAAFDQSPWRVQRSSLVCRLSQGVPHFGEATFETVGGGRQRFIVRTQQNLLMSGPSQLTALAPSWNPTRESIMLGSVEITEGAEPLQLGAESTMQLLDSLQQGLVPTFTRPLQSDRLRMASIALSPVDFRSAYRQYAECIGQLLPVTFDDIKNTVVEFANEDMALSKAAQKKIDLLLRYSKEDRSVTHFEIRAVSSDKARLLENYELAKQRAQQVSDYLTSRGINANAITISYRGARGEKGRQRVVSIRAARSPQKHESLSVAEENKKDTLEREQRNL